MSRRTQLTTKYLFQVLAQLSENFIFIYLGLTLFTETNLEFKPLFIIVTVAGICVARWLAVFPLSKAVNWFIRYRAKQKGREVADELPRSYQWMLFWAGLRGAVGVALAAGLEGANGPALRATVLVVVVLTVIIFGGTTARMLEILGIRTGVVEEIDSDDEFDIETANGGTYYKRAGTALGHTPKRSDAGFALHPVDTNGGPADGTYSSGNNKQSPPTRPTGGINARKNSSFTERERLAAEQNLLSTESISDDDVDFSDENLPPLARRSPKRKPSPRPRAATMEGRVDSPAPAEASHQTARGAIRDLFASTSDDHAAWFKQLDEGFIKPKLLLDQSKGGEGPS